MVRLAHHEPTSDMLREDRRCFFSIAGSFFGSSKLVLAGKRLSHNPGWGPYLDRPFELAK